MHANSNTDFQVCSKHVSSNRIKIQVILQLETDYFSSYLFQRKCSIRSSDTTVFTDFQNCHSTRRSPTGFFSSNSTRVPIHKLHTENSPSKNPILHAEDKELFEYYYCTPEGKETFTPVQEILRIEDKEIF